MQRPTETVVRTHPADKFHSFWLCVWEKVGDVGDEIEGKLQVELKESPEVSVSPNILVPLVGFNLLTIKTCVYFSF